MAITRTITTTCDRCGKVLENRIDERHWKLCKRMFSLKYEDSTDWREQNYWILCYDCTQKLKNFLKSINN